MLKILVATILLIITFDGKGRPFFHSFPPQSSAELLEEFGRKDAVNFAQFTGTNATAVCSDAVTSLYEWNKAVMVQYPNLYVPPSLFSCSLLSETNPQDISKWVGHAELGMAIQSAFTKMKTTTCFCEAVWLGGVEIQMVHNLSVSNPILSGKYSHFSPDVMSDTEAQRLITGLSTLYFSFFVDSSIVEDKKITLCVDDDGNPRTASLFLSGRMESYGSGYISYTRYGKHKSCKFVIGTSPGADLRINFGDERCTVNPHLYDYKEYWSQPSPPAPGNSGGVPGRRQWDAAVLNPVGRGGAGGSAAAYFPLGARSEFKVVSVDDWVPALERKWVFNFMGALETNKERKELMAVLNGMKIKNEQINLRRYLPAAAAAAGGGGGEGGWGGAARAAFVRFTREHTAAPLPFMVQAYHDTLRQSIFTLAPTGHNLECFRLFEALEAGSVPVVLAAPPGAPARCRDPLRPLEASGAPLVKLKTWNNLGNSMQRLLSNATRVAALQARAARWGRGFWGGLARRFEATARARLAFNQVQAMLQFSTTKAKGDDSRPEEAAGQTFIDRRSSYQEEQEEALLVAFLKQSF